MVKQLFNTIYINGVYAKNDDWFAFKKDVKSGKVLVKNYFYNKIDNIVMIETF